MGPLTNRPSAYATRRVTPLITQRYRLVQTKMNDLFLTLAARGAVGGAVLGGMTTTAAWWYHTVEMNRSRTKKIVLWDVVDFILFAPTMCIAGGISGAAIGAVGAPVAVAISPIAVPYLAYRHFSHNKTRLTDSD